MRFEGTLTTWNVERGYGSIAPQQGGQEVFVHVSAFPTEGEPPALGAAFSFEIVSGRDGRKEAARLMRIKRAALRPEERLLAPSSRNHGQRRRDRRARLALVLTGLALAVGLLGWLQLRREQAQLPIPTSALNNQSLSLPQGKAAGLRSEPLRVRKTASKA